MTGHAFIPKLIVLRYSKSTDGVCGTAFDFNGKPFCVTLENQDTLIPADLYEGIPTIYHAGGYQSFELLVPGRKEIKLHKLNKRTQSKGCIGMGEKFYTFPEGTKLAGAGIAESDEAFKEFMSKYGKFEKIYVEIIEHFMEDANNGISQETVG